MSIVWVLAAVIGCGGSARTARTAPEPREAEVCDAQTDRRCFRINVDGRALQRRIPGDRATTIDDGGVERVVVPLTEVIDADAIGNAAERRYKFYATDGFTHGGYATWENIRNGYIEIDTRKLIFAPSQDLSHSFRIKDAFRVEALAP